MVAHYDLEEEQGRVGLMLVPRSAEGGPASYSAERAIESLVQVALVGDRAGGERGQGRTLRNASTVQELRLERHRYDVADDGVEVSLEFTKKGGLVARHELRWRRDAPALEVTTTVENRGSEPVTLELLASFCLGGISPYQAGSAPGSLVLHRLRSGWSSEARLVSEPAESLQLEPAWSLHALNVERFGQVGSMPVRGYAPSMAIEDAAAGVVWGAQLVWSGSWQFELYRRDEALSLAGGLSDGDFGHWRMTLAPGEHFASPPAWLCVTTAGVDDCFQRLVAMQDIVSVRQRPSEVELPAMANEWCTTWGNPTHERLVALADRLAGSGVKYLVIDAGWYQGPSENWFDSHGDWEVDRRRFPQGLEATAAAIRERGVIPGLWVEVETCGSRSAAFSLVEHLLRRDGVPITANQRRFFDLGDPEVLDYLAQRVTSLLERAGIGYLKVDYNETLGIGCDGAESPGEGLRRHVVATHAFYDALRERLPELVMENCASGGHRLEPAMMARFDVGSYSDAFECPEVPIIAANVNRLIPGHRAAVWAVLRSKDSEREQIYKLCSALMGRPCLSGDLDLLDPGQWGLVQAALALYEQARPALLRGHWRRFGPPVLSYRAPTGWQGFVRTAAGGEGVLAVLHHFDGRPAEPVRVDLAATGPLRIERQLGSDAALKVEDHTLLWQPDEPFSAVAAWLVPD